MPKFEQVYKFDYQELDALTSQMSDTAIAKKIGCAVSTVFLARKQFSIKSYSQKTGNKISRKSGRVLEPGVGEYFDKVTVDRQFFKSIDSEVKAYTLGLTATDGFISYNPKGRYFGIELQMPDSIVLHTIAKAITGNDSCVKVQTRLGKKPTERMIVHSRDLVEQLMNLGITSKPLRQCVKDLPEHYARHYLRGIFDGDGCIKKDGGKLGVPSALFASGVAQLVKAHLGLVLNVKERSINGKPFYTIYFEGVNKYRSLIEWTYLNTTIAIPRKLETASIWLSRF